MKNHLLLLFTSSIFVGSASAQGLYQASNTSLDVAPLPFKWNAGLNAIFDDNVSSGNSQDTGLKESALSYNPYVGLSVVQGSGQTTWNVSGMLGLIYYPDPPTVQGKTIDDMSNQSNLSATIQHKLNDQLTLSSYNMFSREREPDYSYGVASSHAGKGEYFSMSNSESASYRWTKRLGTATGLRLATTQYPDAETKDNDRDSYELSNQFRYQLSEQAVVTTSYRFAENFSKGDGADITDNFVTFGGEYRFTPTVIGIAQAGAQFHETSTGTASQDASTTNPYFESSVNAKMNKQFNVKSFLRYSAESDSLNQNNDIFAEHRMLRWGLTNEWSISPKLSVINGFDYMPGTFMGGVSKATGLASPDLSETLVSTYVTVKMKFSDCMTGTLSYTYVNNVSDLTNALDQSQTYNRSRISLGLNVNF